MEPERRLCRHETDAELIDRSENDGYETTDTAGRPSARKWRGGAGSPTGGGEGSEAPPAGWAGRESEPVVMKPPERHASMWQQRNGGSARAASRVASKYLQPSRRWQPRATMPRWLCGRADRGRSLAALRQRTARLEASWSDCSTWAVHPACRSSSPHKSALGRAGDGAAQMEALSSASTPRAPPRASDAMLLSHAYAAARGVQPTTRTRAPPRRRHVSRVSGGPLSAL